MALILCEPEGEVVEELPFDALHVWKRFDDATFAFGEMDFRSLFGGDRWHNGIITFDQLIDRYDKFQRESNVRGVQMHHIHYALTAHSYVFKASYNFRARSYQVLRTGNGNFYCPELGA